MLQVGKVASFILSLLSLHALLASAFFVPGTKWEERLFHAMVSLVLAGCICFASGLLFAADRHSASEPHLTEPHLTETLPVRMFFWATGVMALLWVLSWYLEEYYVPLLWRNQPH